MCIRDRYTSVKYNSVSECKNVSVFLTTASSHGDVIHDVWARSERTGGPGIVVPDLRFKRSG